ncbi:hypothetical protein M0R45_009012 [Rubus argutus]|uniref:Uncharacterized protein n=1 Tax=Rubus argutus TaxID=59490 RepID=A0AAW1Y3C9_RUBAR
MRTTAVESELSGLKCGLEIWHGWWFGNTGWTVVHGDDEGLVRNWRRVLGEIEGEMVVGCRGALIHGLGAERRG